MDAEHAVAEATESSKARWQAFAAELATSSPDTTRGGELLVLGSGLAHMDMLRNDEALIRSADYVFHCLYDRVTQVWIDTLRPDALDLRILYHPEINRYDTYVCMAEAMLHHVRRGRRVVAVFYGHPGIFATPTHRAVKIARNEGYRAMMRPGISALDHLVADLGVDPMTPGLLSYEASDLLLRHRRLDPTLHTVLWQVGAVGEFSYAPQGFPNDGFKYLVERLLDSYDEDSEIIHYIAPQYFGIEALIERHRIGALLDPEVRTRLSSMSTFYIAPSEIKPIDLSMAASLGFDLPEPGSGALDHLYDPSRYGQREHAALRRFSSFVPDVSYSVTGRSPAFEFMFELSRDIDLQRRFKSDPAGVLAEPRFAALSERARKLLAIPHPKAINAAMAEPYGSSAETGRQI